MPIIYATIDFEESMFQTWQTAGIVFEPQHSYNFVFSNTTIEGILLAKVKINDQKLLISAEVSQKPMTPDFFVAPKSDNDVAKFTAEGHMIVSVQDGERIKECLTKKITVLTDALKVAEEQFDDGMIEEQDVKQREKNLSRLTNINSSFVQYCSNLPQGNVVNISNNENDSIVETEELEIVSTPDAQADSVVFDKNGNWKFVGTENPPIDLYIVLNHDKELTWGGIFCPRFSNLNKFFLEEFQAFQRGELVDEKELESGQTIQILQKKLSDRIALNHDLKNLDLHFRCNIFHNILYKCANNENIEIADSLKTQKIIDSTRENPFNVEQEIKNHISSGHEDNTIDYDDIAFTKTTAWADAGDEYFARVKFALKPGTGSTIYFIPRRRNKIKDVTLFDVGTGSEFKFALTTQKQNGEDVYQIVNPMPLTIYQNIANGQWELKILASNMEQEYTINYTKNSIPVKFEPDMHFVVGHNNVKKHVLFMDMGSTRTKFMLVPVTADGKMDINAPIKKILPTFNLSDDSKTVAFLNKMSLLKNFLIENNIKATELKKKIIFNQELFEDFFVAAVQSFAESEFAISNNAILTEVWWSFPLIAVQGLEEGKNENYFNAVNKNISHRLSPWVLAEQNDCFRLVPEHIALKNMFVPLITELINPVFERIKTDYAKEESQIYADASRNKKELLSWRHFIENNRRKKHNEKVEADKEELLDNLEKKKNDPWYRTMKKLHDILYYGDIKDFLLLDGGGYSMDSYCVINGVENSMFSSSFECGGEKLVTEFFERLKKQGLISADTSLGQIKQKILNGDDMPSDRNAVFNATIESIYQSICKVYNAEAENKVKLIVFSGQVTRNPKIRNLFRSTDPDLHVSSSIFRDSLIGLDRYHNDETKKKYNCFEQITNDANRKATSDFDLLGGMFNIASRKPDSRPAKGLKKRSNRNFLSDLLSALNSALDSDSTLDSDSALERKNG